MTLRKERFRATNYPMLYNLIELGSFKKNPDAYLNYFRKRVGNEKVFGEISPSYSMLPQKTYEAMLEMASDVRILYLMRDPASRTISHFGHHLRSNPSSSLDEMIENLNPSHVMYERSNYPYTLNILEKSLPKEKVKPIFYEELISEEGAQDLCTFVGISYVKPAIKKRINQNTGKFYTKEHYKAVRAKLARVYDEMAERYPDKVPQLWPER